MTATLAFLFCAALILFSGSRLSRHGERIAELTGWSRAWLGLILMASVTSLPELFVGIGSAGFLGNADLAVGDVLGSCVFNLAILSLLDALYKGTTAAKRHTVLGQAAPSHVLAASLGIILLAIVGVGLYLPSSFMLGGWIGAFSIVFIAVYLIAIRLLHTQEQGIPVDPETAHTKPDPDGKPTMRNTIKWYAIHALVVIGAALALPHFAEQIAIASGLGATFIGTLLLAASTSLPEVAVSVTALRMGSLDMAVGNLLGSNLFNIFILAIDDLVYAKGSLLNDASEMHIVSVFSTIIMSAIVIVGLTFRGAHKRFLLTWDTLLILLVFIINMVILYTLFTP